MSGCSVTSVERKVNALLEIKHRVYGAFILCSLILAWIDRFFFPMVTGFVI